MTDETQEEQAKEFFDLGQRIALDQMAKAFPGGVVVIAANGGCWMNGSQLGIHKALGHSCGLVRNVLLSQAAEAEAKTRGPQLVVPPTPKVMR